MSRAPLSLAVASAVLVLLVAVLLLAIVPDKVVTSRTGGQHELRQPVEPAEDEVDEIGSSSHGYDDDGGGGGGHSRQLDVEPIESPIDNSSLIAPDEPSGIGKRELGRDSRYYKDQLIRSIADALGHRKFLDRYFLRSVIPDYLDSRERYTILVPDDRVMDPASNVRLARAIKGPRDSWLSYHVLEGRLEDLYMQDEYPILKTFQVSRVKLNWRLNNSRLLAANALVTDGFQKENIALLIIDDILESPEYNFWQAIRGSPRLTKLTSLVRNAKLSKIYKSLDYEPQGVTVFAPSDAAFEQLDKMDLEFLQRDRQLLTKLIWRHVSAPVMFRAGAYFSDQIDWKKNGTRLRIWNQLGEDIFVTAPRADLPVNEQQFKIGDHNLPDDYEMMTVGVLYIVDWFL